MMPADFAFEMFFCVRGSESKVSECFFSSFFRIFLSQFWISKNVIFILSSLLIKRGKDI